MFHLQWFLLLYLWRSNNPMKKCHSAFRFSEWKYCLKDQYAKLIQTFMLKSSNTCELEWCTFHAFLILLVNCITIVHVIFSFLENYNKHWIIRLASLMQNLLNYPYKEQVVMLTKHFLLSTIKMCRLEWYCVNQYNIVRHSGEFKAN